MWDSETEHGFHTEMKHSSLSSAPAICKVSSDSHRKQQQDQPQKCQAQSGPGHGGTTGGTQQFLFYFSNA